MAGDKDSMIAAARVPPAVPARRGYTISRIEAPPPAAASNPPLNPAASSNGNNNNNNNNNISRTAGFDNSSASRDHGRAGPNHQQPEPGGDGGGGKGGGRGRKKRGGKGGGAASGAAGGYALRDNNSAGGAKESDREPKALSPRPAHHRHEQQPVARARQPGKGRGSGGGGGGGDELGDAHGVNVGRGSRDHGRRQYHHEHDDRAEAPRERRQPAARNPRQRHQQQHHQQQHQRQQSRSDAENTASAPKPGSASNGEVAAGVRGRGGNRSGGGGGGILSRLGSPPHSPRPPADDAHPKDSGSGSGSGTGMSIFSRLGSPPPSPRNVLSRADDAGNKQGRQGSHRSEPAAAAAAKFSTSKPGQESAGGKEIPGAHQISLLHPPGRGFPANAAEEGRHQRHENWPQQREQLKHRAPGASGDDGGGGGSRGAALSHPSSSGAAAHTVEATTRNDGNKSSGGGLGRGHGAPSRASSARKGGGGRAAASTVPEARAVVPHAVALRAAGDASGSRQNWAIRRGHQGSERRPPHPQPQQQKQQQQKQQQQVRHEEYARGTCMSMCPIAEMREREAEGGLSAFEATEATSTASVPFRNRTADPGRVVKKYRRSAAGRDMQSPEQLRPLAVLQTTTRYLVQDVFAAACSSSKGGGSSKGSSGSGSGSGDRRQGGGSSTSEIAKAYSFVEDRLRAVRQDLTVQGLVLEGSAGAAEVLKTTANFYIVAGYLMMDEASDGFDRHLHTRELQGVFSSLAEMFFQSKGVELSDPGTVQAVRQSLGADEYLCLQAVHALATAISNSSKSGDMELGEAAGGQGVSRVFASTVTKLCTGDGSSLASPVPLTTPTGRSTGGETDAVEGGGENLAPLPSPFRAAFPKMAMAVRLLGTIYAGNWSEFFRVLGSGVDPGVASGTAGSEGGFLQPLLLLVGDELSSSPFAVRLRCLCHSMLLPVRAHALRAMNKAYGKSEKVPLRDLARILRVRDEGHAAGVCRALSLPVEGEDDNNGGGSGHQGAGADRVVIFKSVPAVWKSKEARTTGFCGPTSARGAKGITGVNDDKAGVRLREDEWVGLARALAAGVPSKTSRDQGSGGGGGGGTVTCDACAGFGCSWCDNGVVPAEERDMDPVDEGLWRAALRPTS